MAIFSYSREVETGPEKINVLRNAWERILDFCERDRALTQEEASLVASQCGQCKTPSCSNHETQRRIPRGTVFVESSREGFSLPQFRLDQLYACPLGNRIPDWEAAVQNGQFDRAFELAMQTNLWADITGQVCPPGICEASCNLHTAGLWSGHIRAIERFIGDYGWKNGLHAPLKVDAILNKRIAIIGAGPAGFYPGHDLRAIGCDVTFYDANDVAGGLATRGLPGMKIDNGRIFRHFKRLEEAGVNFCMNTKIGDQVEFAKLAAQNDAIVIATGAYSFKQAPGIAGSGVQAIVQGIPYLQTQNCRDDGQTPYEFVSGKHNAFGKHVVVVGAGDTAFDAVGTILRQQMDSKNAHHGKVTLLVRGDHMRAIEKEIKANREEASAIAMRKGCKPEDVLDIRFNTALVMVNGGADNIESVVIRDSDGAVQIKAEMVVMAIGSSGVDLKKSFGLPYLNQNADGMIKSIPWKGRPGTRWQGGGLAGIFRSVSHLGERYVPVYAVGDITRDGSQKKRRSLLVDALADGRDTVRDIVYGLQDSEALAEQSRDLILN